MKAVFDASVLVKLLTTEPETPSARALIGVCDEPLAPDWAQAECASVIWKRVRRGELPPALAGTRLTALDRLMIGYRRSAELLPAAFALAIELDHPVYDCLYLALALTEDCPLVTADRRLAEAAGRAGVVVEFVGRNP